MTSPTTLDELEKRFGAYSPLQPWSISVSTVELQSLIADSREMEELKEILRKSDARHLMPESEHCQHLVELPMFHNEYLILRTAITAAMEKTKDK